MDYLFKQGVIFLFSFLFTLNVFAGNTNIDFLQQFKDTLKIENHKKHLVKINKGYLISKSTHNNGKGNESKKSEDQSSISPASAAEPLYYLEIVSVASEDYPYWENIDPNDFATSQNHGGNFIYVATLEGGYAEPYSRKMKINGSTLVKMHSEPIYNDVNTLIGWFHIWGTTYYIEGGLATYEATSTNYPWNSMLDRLTIQ